LERWEAGSNEASAPSPRVPAQPKDPTTEEPPAALPTPREPFVLAGLEGDALEAAPLVQKLLHCLAEHRESLMAEAERESLAVGAALASGAATTETAALGRGSQRRVARAVAAAADAAARHTMHALLTMRARTDLITHRLPKIGAAEGEALRLLGQVISATPIANQLDSLPQGAGLASEYDPHVLSMELRRVELIDWKPKPKPSLAILGDGAHRSWRGHAMLHAASAGELQRHADLHGRERTFYLYGPSPYGTPVHPTAPPLPPDFRPLEPLAAAAEVAEAQHVAAARTVRPDEGVPHGAAHAGSPHALSRAGHLPSAADLGRHDERGVTSFVRGDNRGERPGGPMTAGLGRISRGGVRPL